MKNEIAIQAIRSRPRFRVKTKMTRTEFVNRLKSHMENHKQVIFGFANNEMAELQLYKDSEKYWSPQLQIRIEENEENSDFLEIRGVFGPRSSVWTFLDRKSTRLNSSHVAISYAVFCLKKKYD